VPKQTWRPSRGMPVQVRNRFDQAWVSGFEVEQREGEAEARYRVRRRSDRRVLPVAFAEGELRPES
jgi:hypothetical protein